MTPQPTRVQFSCRYVDLPLLRSGIGGNVGNVGTSDLAGTTECPKVPSGGCSAPCLRGAPAFRAGTHHTAVRAPRPPELSDWQQSLEILAMNFLYLRYLSPLLIAGVITGLATFAWWLWWRLPKRQVDRLNIPNTDPKARPMSKTISARRSVS
jgi:hypothetical protein